VKDPNVSGAGDTYISALLLALVSGAPLQTAASIASAAASIVIANDETATCYTAQLIDFFANNEKTIQSIAQLKQKCLQLKKEGKKIVFTNGCFDILHSGHVNYIKKARAMGDVLIVGVNKDDSIRRLKGKDRPINGLNDRMEVLSALASVDFVIAFGSSTDDTPIELIKNISPDIFVKGGDYQHQKLPEASLLKKIGCQVAFVPIVHEQSTSKIIEKVQRKEFAHLKVAAN
jgi:D-beta-D-heptose 7-phosphate kinase/D-beta-D-heptose 1-phosphate adenosyltransferase